MGRKTHETAGAMRAHWWYRGRAVAVLNLARRPHVPHGVGTVLDYGCGTGHMGPVLARFGPVYGVDSSADALAAGHYESYAAVTHVPVDDNVSLPGRPHSLIACLDVLEHVDDDVGLLASLAGLLQPNGYLIVSTPMWPDLFCAEEARCGHLRRYSKESLRHLFVSARLRPVAASGYIVSLLPLARAHRRRIIAGRASFTEEMTTPPWLANEALTLWASAEGLLSRYLTLPTGLSEITVLQRATA